MDPPQHQQLQPTVDPPQHHQLQPTVDPPLHQEQPTVDPPQHQQPQPTVDPPLHSTGEHHQDPPRGLQSSVDSMGEASGRLGAPPLHLTTPGKGEVQPAVCTGEQHSNLNTNFMGNNFHDKLAMNGEWDPHLQPKVDPPPHPTVDPPSQPHVDPPSDTTVDPTQPTVDPPSNTTEDPTRPTVDPSSQPTVDPPSNTTVDTTQPTVDPPSNTTVDHTLPTVDSPQVTQSWPIAVASSQPIKDDPKIWTQPEPDRATSPGLRLTRIREKLARFKFQSEPTEPPKPPPKPPDDRNEKATMGGGGARQGGGPGMPPLPPHTMEIPEEAPDSDSSLKPNPSSETTQTQNKGQTGGGGARQGGVPEMHPLPLRPQSMEVPEEVPEEVPDTDSSHGSQNTQIQNRHIGGGGARQGGVPEMHPLPLKPQPVEVPCTETQSVRNHKVRDVEGGYTSAPPPLETHAY